MTYVAKQIGDSAKTVQDHYAGVIEELEDQPRTSASEAIRRARHGRGLRLVHEG